MIAVEQGHEEVVCVILQHSKSDVHQVANDGVTTAFSLAKLNSEKNNTGASVAKYFSSKNERLVRGALGLPAQK